MAGNSDVRPCSVKVRFISDNDVMQHIENIANPVKSRRKLYGGKKVKVTHTSMSFSDAMQIEEEDVGFARELKAMRSQKSDETAEILSTPSKRLNPKKQKVNREDVFEIPEISTGTPKTQKTPKAGSAITPKTQNTPKTKTPASQRPVVTPSTGKASRSKAKHSSNTPHRLRERNENPSSDSESATSGEDNTESEDDSEEDEIVPPKKRQLTANVVERYFEAQGSKAVTSNRTLSRMEVLNKEEVDGLLDTFESPHAAAADRLHKEYRLMFNEWTLQLISQFNLLFYGYGSKKNLIEEYRQFVTKKGFAHAVVNGYFPSLTLKSILNSISKDCFGLDDTFTDTRLHVEAIKKYLDEEDEKFFLFIHNIDGQMLRNESVQADLSFLCQSPHVYCVASIDCLNASLLWNAATLSRFNWYWHDVTTFQRYVDETSYDTLLTAQSDNVVTLNSLLGLVGGVNSTSKRIFLMLVKYQLDHEGESGYMGMPFPALLRKCIEGFLLHSDVALKAQLNEFNDHKVIRWKKTADSTETVVIAANKCTLEDFQDAIEESSQ